ncbi:MAG: hypothetical protein M0C28_08125 [Candidatus Moduliflexus flocculans]|nr:hypothetical protein [Candidatus Moduliflexus flocculans]
MRLACQAVTQGDVEVFMEETAERTQQLCPGLVQRQPLRAGLRPRHHYGPHLAH